MAPKDSRPVCRYFAQSCCKLPAGECAFRHERTQPSDTICKFFLSGSCAYGSKCRLDHVKPARPAAPQPPPPSRRAPPAAAPPALPRAVDARTSWSSVAASSAAAAETPLPAELEALRLEDGGEPPPLPKPPKAADPWASLADGRAAAAPEPAVAAEVAARAARVALRAEQLASSASVECGICLETVLSKPAQAERSFGLLPGCSHPFCLGCIRAWRASPQSREAMPGAAAAASEAHARTCPLCRVVSYHVVPSPVWPRDDVEKAELMESYRNRLSAVPCRHFEQGRGSCPFGTSCFYSHTLADGSEAPRVPQRRYAVGAEGEEVRVVEPLRLGAFLG